mmetsp:Transcript_29737/g.42444  ORF Transcript_29737/g.42444 Transcript_29737/m.42444 type:complete len:743 (+) Transcript_29737:3709-5937(+)
MIRNNQIHNLLVVVIIYYNILLNTSYRLKVLPLRHFPFRTKAITNRKHYFFHSRLYSLVDIRVESDFVGEFNESSLISLKSESSSINKFDQSVSNNISFNFDYRTSTPETLSKSLEMMKLVDLKLYLRQLGGKSSRGVKKAEILERCHTIISLANSTSNRHFGTSNGDNTDESDDESDVHKISENVIHKLQSMKPVETKPVETKPSNLSIIALKAAIEQQIANRTKLSMAGSFGDRYRANSSSSFNSNFTKVPSSKGTAKLSKKLSMKPYEEVNNNSSNNNDDNYSVRRSRFPVGQLRNCRFDNNSSHGGDMDLTFLGTASCIPTLSRGVSCIAFRHNSDTWLFDVGEASQVQLSQSFIKPSKIKKIFISHTHGDHAFGLPGVLCLIGQSTTTERARLANEGEQLQPIDIYGPEGIRDFVRAAVQLTYSRIVAPHRIHELKSVPYLHGKCVKYPPPFPVVRTRFDEGYGEKEGGRDIYPDRNGHYHLFDEESMMVTAAPMQHTIPCVGFVVTEKDRLGTLNADRINDIVLRNQNELQKLESLNYNYMKIFAKIKSMQLNESYTFPDGTVVQVSDVVDPPRKGRKLVVMGDTCSGEYIAPLAMDADLIVHEATNAWLREMDGDKYAYPQLLEKDTFMHGHSTPQMAGVFARRIRAKRLVLTHFSPRYAGDNGEASMRTMWRIEDLAREASGLQGPNDVVAAWDYMLLQVPTKVTTVNDSSSNSSDDCNNKNSTDTDSNIQTTL